MKGDIETVKVKGKWVNRVQGRYKDRGRAIAASKHIYGLAELDTVQVRRRWTMQIVGRHDTQKSAGDIGNSIAKILKVEWFLKDRFGRIRERNTYGHDPRDIKG